VLLAPPSPDPSFPSDHAVAAFAIAFSVLLAGGRRAGFAFLAGAVLIAGTRVLVGLHYPGDVAAGVLVGLASALLVAFAGRGRWPALLGLLGRIGDPVLAPAWRALDAQRARRGRATPRP
jgi:membrane-associated phospholipid phosphatase